jgi:acyl-CoA hydrolase
MKVHTIERLVKGEDLNHHGTLFAGRMAEWFVEGAFIAAASIYGKPESIVCLKIHGFKFSAPINKGDIVKLNTLVINSGRTSITVYGKVTKNSGDTVIVDGFITFVSVDEKGNKIPHHINLPKWENEEEIRLYEIAKKLKQL